MEKPKKVHMKVRLEGFIYCLCTVHPAAKTILTTDRDKITCERCIFILELDMNHFD